MSAVVDSKHQKLSTDEIISIAAQETRSQYSPEQVKAALVAEAHGAGAIIMRQGNTLFILHKYPKDETVGVFRALNADTAKNYVENGKMFVKAAASMGFKTLVAQFQDEGLLNIFKAISKKPPLPNMGYAVQKTQGGGYQVTVSLGDAQKGNI
jgi:hypothetical protein